MFAEASTRQASRPSSTARFGRLPMVASCASTDLPAAVWRSDAPPDRNGRPRAGDEPVPMSAEVAAKRRMRSAADQRMRALVGATVTLLDIDVFFEQVDWVAVVHADGNGLGGLFQRAPEVLGDAAMVAELSRRVQAAADAALRAATAQVPARRARGGSDRSALALVPLVVGGDDLTVLVDGSAAIPFVQSYLVEFGRATRNDELIRRVNDGRGLTAAAGVAVVKPHFPFSAAYGLAEDLCRNAKGTLADLPVGVPAHAVDLHVLFDSVVSSLETLRGRVELATAPGLDGALSLHERPFLLAAADDGPLPADTTYRDLGTVLRRAAAVAGCANGRGDGAVVTRSQLHALREELTVDVGRAERRFADLWRRASESGSPQDRGVLAELAGSRGDPPGLVRPVSVDHRRWSTPLFDAMELADLTVGAKTR
ncbi:conserved hypothetical protein [Parafrankia sp. EAN1pec]|nr:conserved hypothetical protein [Frankia sp. EAN1pec]